MQIFMVARASRPYSYHAPGIFVPRVLAGPVERGEIGPQWKKRRRKTHFRAIGPTLWPKGGYHAPIRSGALLVSCSRYFVPQSQRRPPTKIIPETTRNARFIVVALASVMRR